MPIGDPWDGFFYPILALVMDSYSIVWKQLNTDQPVRAFAFYKLCLDTTIPVLGGSDKVRLKQSPQLPGPGRNFACSKSRYDTFQYVNNKGADQTVRLRRLVSAFVVGKH